MSIRFADQNEIKVWDKYILSNQDGGNVFQGYEFSKQKTLGGWNPRYIFQDDLAITILEKNIPGLGKLWYAPKGPGISSTRELDNLLPSFKDFAKKHNVFTVKIEPEILKKDETLVDLLKLGLIRTRPIQPNFSTITVDLSPNIETILSHLNQKGRHAIKRAERDGVIIKQVDSSSENCQLMYDLLSETAAGSFSIRSFSYYKHFWQQYSKAKQGQLFFAYVNGEVVAGAYALIFGKKSTYKDGASIRERTVYGASHLLQWKVIEWAKVKGALIHDLCGTPPSDQIKNPDHPHYGIGRFKTSFNKEVTDYIGAYDIVISSSRYRIWSNIGERIALRLYRYFHHESYY